jgi:hypothetical protein
MLIALISIAALCVESEEQTSKEKKEPAPSSYGKVITVKEATPLKSIVADIKKYNNQTLRVEGTIADVCQRKGCWLVVADGQANLRVTFEGYSFFVPKDSAGRKVVLQGVVKEEEISEGAARHYAEEQKTGNVKPEDIKGPQRVITMVASGVRILN